MDRWDLLIILSAAYVAVISLVRLMAGRRNELIDHVREKIKEQRSNAQPAEASEAKAEQDAA